MALNRSTAVRLVCVFLAGALATSASEAQDSSGPVIVCPAAPSTGIGLYGGVSHSFLPTLPDPLIFEFTHAQPAVSRGGDGYHIGAEMALPLVRGTTLLPRVALTAWRGRSTSTGVGLVGLDDSGRLGEDTTALSTRLSVESDVEIDMVSATMIAEIEIAEVASSTWLGLLLGPAIDFVVRSRLRQEIVLDALEPGRFSNPMGLPTTNDERTIVTFDDEIPGRGSFRSGLLAGLRLSHEFVPSWKVWTSLQGDVALRSVIDEGRVDAAVSLSVGVMRWF